MRAARCQFALYARIAFDRPLRQSGTTIIAGLGFSHCGRRNSRALQLCEGVRHLPILIGLCVFAERQQMALWWSIHFLGSGTTADLRMQPVSDGKRVLRLEVAVGQDTRCIASAACGADNGGLALGAAMEKRKCSRRS